MATVTLNRVLKLFVENMNDTVAGMIPVVSLVIKIKSFRIFLG